jgi:hypothetical protein
MLCVGGAVCRCISVHIISRLLLAGSGAEAPAVEPGEPTNFVFVLADDLGWGDVGYQCKQTSGLPQSCPRTPHIDAMASAPHTVQFSHFYAGAPNCSPTRASLL